MYAEGEYQKLTEGKEETWGAWLRHTRLVAWARLKSKGKGHVQTFVRSNIFFVEGCVLFGLFIVR